MKLCLACFKECEDNLQSCPHCGYGSDSFARMPSALPIGTILQGRYMTGKAEMNKNGIVYAAFDNQTKKAINLIEYYPEDNVSGRRGNALIYIDAQAAEKALSKLENKKKNKGFAVNNTFYTFSDYNTAEKSARAKANRIFRNIAYISSFICLLLSAVYLLKYFVLDNNSYQKNALAMPKYAQRRSHHSCRH